MDNEIEKLFSVCGEGDGERALFQFTISRFTLTRFNRPRNTYNLIHATQKRNFEKVY